MSFIQSRLGATWDLLEVWNQHEGVRAISAETGDQQGVAGRYHVGYSDAGSTTPVDAESKFLIASPTKPFIATAVMCLVEKGVLQVSDKVSRYIPEFGSGHKSEIRIAHLLTHTSGLPDMLPNNIELRKAKAPLTEFQFYTNKVELVYSPGTRVHYQSMGILTLSTILELVTSLSTRELLRQLIFDPLNMSFTSLGLSEESIAAEGIGVSSMVETEAGHDDWGWNSPYWRKLGAPWGGLISTSADLGIFCRHLLAIHSGEDGVVSPSTLKAMTTNQLEGFPKLRQGSAAAIPWGLGWQLNWPHHPRGFGAVLPPQGYGHWGATGTLVWIDPCRKVYGIVLTNEPMGLEDRRQIKFANLSRLVWD